MGTLQKQIERIFSEKGLLADREGFEYRPQQEEMALAIASALEDQEHLLVEAPTGIGKSLAYLVPSILFALENRKKAVIATHTKNLQEQLWHNDLALVRSLIPLPVAAALLKGRRNYLCTTRLRNAIRQPKLVFEGDRTDDLSRIAAWADETIDGDLDSVPFPLAPEVRSRLGSEHGVCNSATCGPDCFFQRAKRLARGADLVIVNHALFFTLLPTQDNEEGYLFPNDFVVIDEAHMLEQTAGLGLSRTLSRQQVLFAIHRLFNPRTRKGLLARQRAPEFREECERAVETAEQFFSAITAASRRVNATSPAVWWQTPVPVSDQLGPALRRLDELVTGLSERKSIRIPPEELLSVRRLLQEADSSISSFLFQEERSSTYWVELPTNAGGNVSLCSAPTSTAESVGPMLFKGGTSAVLTSATLAVGTDLSYCQQRFGAEDARALRLDSPFNFRALMRIVVTPDIPQPDEPGYEDALPDWILRSIHRSHGRALVLFTNAALMRRMAERLRGPLAEEGIPLLVQSGAGSRHGLLQEFKADVDSVLFGLDSFWMGVDVPGEALEHVIITRLPFSVPDHPLILSRLEVLKQRGEQPFMAYSLPEAVLKLRQGVGRLIRRSDDHGLITILDSRIVRKAYGKLFLESLPRCPVDIVREDGEVEAVERE